MQLLLMLNNDHYDSGYKQTTNFGVFSKVFSNREHFDVAIKEIGVVSLEEMFTKIAKFKAKLHEAIFIVTSNAMSTTEKHSGKLQRGFHSFAIFFSQLAKRACWKLLTMLTNLSSAARLKSPASVLIGPFPRNCVLGCDEHVACSNLSRNVAKVEDSSTFLATRNATFYCIAGYKNGVLHLKSFLELATQRLMRHKLQEKLPCVCRERKVSCNLYMRI